MPETRIDVKTGDGVADCYGFRPQGTQPVPAVVMFFDAFGMRPAMKEMADHLAQRGYFVLLPNLYYRAGPFAPFNTASAFSDPSERERLMKLIHTLTPEGIRKDFGAYLSILAKTPGVKADKLGCTGYCMGGRLALTAAGLFPDVVAAAASFHGGQLVTDAPDSPHRSADKIRGRLYFGVADEDRSCTPEDQAKLKAALDAADVRYQLELYAGAKHGFAVTDVPVYDAAASAKHWERTFSLFGQTLS